MGVFCFIFIAYSWLALRVLGWLLGYFVGLVGDGWMDGWMDGLGCVCIYDVYEWMEWIGLYFIRFRLMLFFPEAVGRSGVWWELWKVAARCRAYNPDLAFTILLVGLPYCRASSPTR